MEDALADDTSGEDGAHAALFLRLANQHEELPKVYSLTRLMRATRGYITSIEALDAVRFADLREPEGPLEEIAWSYLRAPIMGTGDPTEAIEQEAIEVRAEVLSKLSVANDSALLRRERACEIVTEHKAFFTGLSHQRGAGAPYQLGVERPWWRPGDIERNELARIDLDNDPRKLVARGFVQIEREEYLRRTRAAIMRSLVTRQPASLNELAAIIAVYTASRSERRQLAALQSSLCSRLVVGLMGELEARGILVPMQPLYSLPREARGMETFLVSRARGASDLREDEGSQTLYPRDHEDFRVRARPAKNKRQTSLFFFQRDLVDHGDRSSRRGNTFIELTLDVSGKNDADTLAALLRGVEALDVDARALEHLPRVCAGMFTAAQKDRRLGFGRPGTFWDTESGRRLCQVVGFDPDNPRHRSRIQDIRRLFETIILHRQVRTSEGRIEWSGPIIEHHASEITLDAGDRDGLSERNVFHSWSIAKELWDMVTPASQGGAPSFMLLDERAFELDASSSVSFNLYWTLVNRAYMGSYTRIKQDRVDKDGVFKPRIGTLYKWSGLEGRHSRPYRLREVMAEAFDLMKSHGLLTRWECPELMPDSGSTWQDLLRARVELGLAHEQLESLREPIDAPSPYPGEDLIFE